MDLEMTKILLAVLLGAFISSIGYFVRLRYEKVKVINKVIFSLLEIWHRLNYLVQFDVDVMFEIFEQYLNKKELQKTEVDTCIKDAKIHFEKHYMNLANKLVDIGSEEMSEGFNDNICKLSEMYPILAFRINGNQDYNKIMVELSASIDNSLKEVEKEVEGAKSQAAQTIRQMQKYIIKKLFERVESNLLEVSKAKSFLYEFKMISVLNVQKRIVEQSAKDEMNGLFDHIIDNNIQ